MYGLSSMKSIRPVNAHCVNLQTFPCCTPLGNPAHSLLNCSDGGKFVLSYRAVAAWFSILHNEPVVRPTYLCKIIGRCSLRWFKAGTAVIVRVGWVTRKDISHV